MDYKYDIQMLAEEIAFEKYDCSYYELSDDLQIEVYMEAQDVYWETRNYGL